MDQYNKDFGYYDEATGTYAMTAGAQTCLYGVEIGCMFLAAMAAGNIGTKLGRKVGLVLDSVLGLLGCGIQMIPHYAAAVVGRGVMGLAIGFAGQFAIPYWSEAAPVYFRGSIVILYQFFINVPTLIGTCIDQATYDMQNRWSYRIPLLATFVAPIALLCLIYWVPESPRWLITRGRINDARTSIRKLRGPHAQIEELDREISQIAIFVELETQMEASTSYIECFKGSDLRRTMITTLVAAGQQLMGVGFLGSLCHYEHYLCRRRPCGIRHCELVGRRPIMIIGAAVQALSMLDFAAVAQGNTISNSAGDFMIFCICLFTFTYSVSWGSVGSIMLGEVPSNRLRSKTISISMSASWIVCLAIDTGVPYLLSAEYADLGAKVGFIFGPIGVCVFIASYFVIPETKGRTLEDLDEMFMNGITTRKFKSYVCTGTVGSFDTREAMDEKQIIVEEIDHVPQERV